VKGLRGDLVVEAADEDGRFLSRLIRHLAVTAAAAALLYLVV